MRWSRTLAFLAFLAVAAGGDAWADPVSVSVSRGDGYGRMTFGWPSPVGHIAKREGDRLVVTFSRPIEADLRPVLRGLSDLVASTEAAPDQATVVLRVKGDFSVRSYDTRSSVVVDIVGAQKTPAAPPPKTQAPATQPKPAAKPAKAAQPSAESPADAPRVGVRTGVHDTFTRVVFDWPERTDFALARDGGRTTLNFTRPGRADVAALAKGGARHIGGAKTAGLDGNLAVELAIDPTSRVNAFVTASKVVVDVYAPGTQKAAPAKPAPKPEAQPVAQAEPAPAPEQAPVPEQAAPAATVQGEEPPQPQSAPVDPVTLAKSEEPTAPAQPVTEPPQDAKAVAEPQPGPRQLQPQDAATQDGEAAAKKPSVDEPMVETRAQGRKIDEGLVELKFSWDEPVGAAVFRRDGVLWVVFDKRAKIDTDALIRDGDGLISSVEQVPSRVGAVLRMVTPEGVNPNVKRSGLAWVLEFAQQPLIPTAPLQAESQPDSPLGARLFVAVPQPGNIITFQDPEVGDNLIAVPVIPLGHGLSRTWTYPQLSLLPSKQGVIIKPLSDDVRVRPLREGVEMTSTGTLHISPVSAEQKANVDLASAMASGAGMDAFRPMTRILDLEKWKRPDLASFNDTRQALQNVIIAARGKVDLEKAQRELAHFYFANGFSAEVLGVLGEMERLRPEIKEEAEHRLLFGASHWLMGRMEDARAYLFHKSLEETDEGRFWRAAVLAGENNMREAAYDLRKLGAVTAPYPKPLKMPMATLVADAAVELGDFRQAEQYLEVLNVEEPSAPQKNQIDLVMGKLHVLKGEFDEAVTAFESVMDGGHRPSRAKAAVARAELLLQQKHFTQKDAIEEYEKLRFVWRGDDFEFEMLRRLGGLYLDEQLYREGLQTLRQAATHFPQHKEKVQITKLMSDTFQNLYLQNAADVLPPVTAIALYDEFRELTPPGELGDEMLRRLADRLVGVDLLERAAELLESQIEFRLKGDLKSRVGARLALIYLFNRDHKAVLKALTKTVTAKMSDELLTERNLLRAQAHIGLGEPMVALDVLSGEPGLQAERIRADIYWAAGDWANAAKALNKIVHLIDAKPRKALDGQQAAMVLSLSIAYTLAGNEVGASRMVENYGAAMGSTPYADAFRLITSPPETGLVNYRALDEVAKKVESFQTFMAEYRQRVQEGQLSAVY
ncbi:MAG: hypothetical protein HQL35_09560 [Alphaproteobacteria bacterium]|nr:hypothetical protein [Alphaproteobacteria bacterium]